jgi:competence protein ComEC
LVAFSLKIKQKLIGIHTNTLPQPYASLMTSFIFGRSSADIPSEIEKSYMRSGLVHLLVVSGTQVSLLLGFAVNFFRFLNFTPLLAFISTSIFNIFYLIMIGFQPSIIRASLMVELALFAGLVDKDNDGFNALFFSALLMLLFQPIFLFDIGFQLSYAATFALIWAAPVVASRLTFFPSWLANALAVGSLPTFLTFPITAFYFNQVSLISVISNVLIVPWVGILVTTGFLATVIGVFSPFLCYLINNTNLLVFIALNKLVNFFSQLPFALYFTKSPTLIFVLFYYGSLYLLLEFLKDKTKFRFSKVNVALIFLFAFSLLVWQGFGASSNSTVLNQNKLTVSFIDVKQGDSIFIESPSGKKVLIDGGPYEFGDEDSFDAGNKIVLPFLRKKGINTLDLVVVSHPHSDHVGGLISIMEDLKVKMVADSGYPHPTPTYFKFLEEVNKKKIPYKIIKEGDKIDFGSGIYGYVLHPSNKFLKNTNSDINNNSVVIFLAYNKLRFLFPGDLEKEGEKILLLKHSNFDNSLNILKVGHHGSDTSSTTRFLSAFKPQIGIISVGKKNLFGHPKPDLLKRLEEKNVKVFRTDLNGDIIVETDGEKYKISVER